MIATSQQSRNQKLVYVYGHAGSGKTTTIRNVLTTKLKNSNFLTITIDARKETLRSFDDIVRHISFVAFKSHLTRGDETNIDQLSAALATMLSDFDYCVVVIDNFHLVRDHYTMDHELAKFLDE